MKRKNAEQTEKIKKAIADYASEQWSAQAEPAPPLAESFWKKHGAAKPPHCRKILVALAACLALMLVSVTAPAKTFINTVISICEKYISVSAPNSRAEPGDYVDWSGLYMPSYLPDGYRLQNEPGNGDIISLQYDGLEGDSIFFKQYRNFNFQLDKEKCDSFREVTINGQDGFLVKKDGQTSILWGESTRLVLIGTVDAKLLIKIAEGVVYVPAGTEHKN